jgi:hypothetical protein
MLSDAERARREQQYRDGCAEAIRNDPTMRATLIAECTLCDPDGYRGSTVCDHIDHTEAAKRGMELVRAEIAKTKGGKH